MEPDILASPSEAPAAERWNPATPPETSSPAPRANGVAPGVAHPNGNGYANGHARVNGNGAVAARLDWKPSSGNGLAVAPGAAAGRPAARRLGAFDAAAESHRESGAYLRWGKRVLDVVGAAGALLISLPVLAIAAIAIKLESPGPVFYRSTRIGRGGRSFSFLKLRSMVQDADRHRHQLTHLNECDGPVFKISRDPRVTRVGRFLRTTSIDEIPQFLNVLAGHMSLVGPRPPIPEEVAQYEPWQLRRLDVRPGITCLWQISGRSRIGFHEWMRLDLEYIRRRSFALDLGILVRTIPAVLSREGAY